MRSAVITPVQHIMKNERTQFLARLETGFRMDRAHLEELEHVLALAVLSARHFGAAYGGSGVR